MRIFGICGFFVYMAWIVLRGEVIPSYWDITLALTNVNSGDIKSAGGNSNVWVIEAAPRSEVYERTGENRHFRRPGLDCHRRVRNIHHESTRLNLSRRSPSMFHGLAHTRGAFLYHGLGLMMPPPSNMPLVS
jgi:hypothetical protein